MVPALTTQLKTQAASVGGTDLVPGLQTGNWEQAV